MIKRIDRIFCLLAVLLSIAALCSAQAEITREELFQIPEKIAAELLGMRVNGGKVFIAASSGRYVRFDPDTREALNGKMETDRIADFDIMLGQPLFLDANGRIGGKKRQGWPDQNFSATFMEVSNEGLMLGGMGKLYFLEKNATAPVEIKGLSFALPFGSGFFWSMQIRPATGLWGVDIYECLGNLMKEAYTFSPEFSPTGLEAGPAGPEGEILISSFEGEQRKLILIGNNGHMFWKIDGPEKLCARDIGFDASGNLLVLERKGDQIWLNRWKMVIPEG